MIRKIFFILFISKILFAQFSYNDANSDVYNYLRKNSVKGFTSYNDNIKPLSRIYIAQKLVEIKKSFQKLNQIEIDELSYWSSEYDTEIKIINRDSVSRFYGFFAKQNNNERLNFFHYTDSIFSFTINPILAYKIGSINNTSYSYLQNGFYMHGSYGNSFGFYLKVYDNSERGSYVKSSKIFSRQSGINKLVIDRPDDILENSELDGEFAYNWSWGNVSIGKNNVNWGSGIDGKIILSSKAPSFPFVKLALRPTDWFYFEYLHGWLQSKVIDSSSIRKTLVPGRESFSQVEKYIAAHIVRINPFENLSISLGESVIYSEKLEYMYFIPFLFFRFADHYLQDVTSNSGDNAQIFSDISYNIKNYNVELYASSFIDELSIRKGGLINGNGSAIAFTLGAFLVDPFFKNSQMVIEYTRINPFVYMNSDDTQLYRSHGYQLGHWIGSNADELYVSYQKNISSKIVIETWADHIRKGSKELPEQQYQLPYPKFLFGERTTFTEWGVKLNYKLLHDAEIKVEFSNAIEYDNQRDAYATFKHLFVNFLIGL